MKKFKRTFLRAFFAIEAMIFAFMYLFGAQGIRVMHQMEEANKTLDGEIEKLTTEVRALEHEIIAWQSNPFFKEKVARERLHMARKNDLIFYID